MGNGRSSRMREETEEKEDRISNLPDELIHEILKYLDSHVAVQTSILSKRWLNIWTSLPCLNLKPITYPKVPAHHNNFVRNFLKYRNRQSVISTFRVDYIILNRRTINYLLYHNVEHLSIYEGWLKTSPRLKSKSLKTLHLTRCSQVYPMHWTLPSLTSLYLDSVRFGNEISGFENLTDLTLMIHCLYNSAERVFNIKCPNLRNLTLGGFSQCDKLFVSAPVLSCFKLQFWNLPELYAGDGFHCITEVDIHINFPYFVGEKDIMLDLIMQNLITMFKACRGTPLLKLSMETIQLLEKIPDVSRYQPCPLKNLKFLLLQWRYKIPTSSTNRVHEMPPISTNHVIKYLLSNSPSAEMLKGK